MQKDRIGSWEVSGLTGAALPLPARIGKVRSRIFPWECNPSLSAAAGRCNFRCRTCTWISIPVPGASEVAAFLYDANILDPGLVQACRGQEAAKAAPNDHHVDRVG